MKTATALYESLRTTRPKTKQDLKNYVKVFLGVDIPNRKICPEHNAPIDYLWHSFNSDFERPATSDEQQINADCVVWANRAGGKTELAAIATLLDCIFKPDCKSRILAGSGDQASRLYEYLLNFLKACPEQSRRDGFEKFLSQPPKKDSCRFINNSDVEVLTQSATSIRGQHIQKLRCDEVELFEEDVFNAAKFTTQSRHNIIAAMEVISTMHRPYGLMQKIVTDARKHNTPIFKWCIWETIEKCTDRNCSQCTLWNDCRAKAKKANGYLKIDDIITQMRRSSRACFESEMLCKKPSLENVVFDEFQPDLHVKEISYDPNLPLYRSLDFGFINPFVCLWLQVDDNRNVRVIDEYVRHRATIHIHAEQIKQRTQGHVTATFCDPAGQSPNDVTGTSATRELRSMGIPTRYRRSTILEGIELIRRALRSGDGKTSILISPKCSRLIEAMQCYHYPESNKDGTGGPVCPPSELPLKDGLYDHPIDALRYFFVNYSKNTQTRTRKY